MAQPEAPTAVSREVGREIAWYPGLTLAASAVFYVAIARSGGLAASPWLVVGLMWTPGVVALALQYRYRGTLRGLGWGAGRPRYLLAAYFLPIAYAFVAYSAVWSSPAAEVDGDVFARLGRRAYLLIPGTLLSSLAALGEEIGWRGYLVPRLARRFGLDGVALASGLVWALWHYPLILFADYRSAAPVAYSLACFTVMVVGLAYLYAWITLRSGSLWPAVLLHASHNLYVQGVFDRATIDTGPTPYWTGEFGAALALAATALALACRRLAGELELPRNELSPKEA